MNPLPERYSDLVGDRDDAALLACVADLDATCAVFALSPEQDAAIVRNLTAQAIDPNPPIARTWPSRGTWLRVLWQPARWRLASLVLAVLVAGSGIGAYLHGHSPTPVNAQTLLHRVAAVSPGPNEAAHSTYRVSAGGGYTGTADAWVGVDASSVPTEFALTVTMSRDGHPAPELSSQRVLAAQTMRVYEPASNTVTISSPRGSDQELEGMFVGVLVAQKLSRALQAKQQNAFGLQQQTLDGVPVYALTLGDSASQTFYFNTQTYVLEGADWMQAGRSWQARLDPDGYHTLALSAVPPQTFTLNAHPTARVVTEPSADGSSKGSAGGAGPQDEIVKGAVAACSTTTQAFTAALQRGDESMLAICRQTNPGMTADRLVTALIAPFKADMDAQVTSGTMTAAQETDNLANLRMKLTYMVTGQPGTKSGTKPGGK